MVAVNGKILFPLKDLVGETFNVRKYAQHSILFVNNRVTDATPKENWHVECQDLPHEDVLKIGQVLKDVYDGMEPEALKGVSRTDHYQKLNNAGKLSAQYVSFVLNLEGSSLHKYFLLTSGHGIVSTSNISTMMDLARAKHPIQSLDQAAVKDFWRTFLDLEIFYILPGVNEKTESLTGSALNSRMHVTELRYKAALLAFLSDKSSDLTLEEHLAKDVSESIQTTRSLSSLASFTCVDELLQGRYKELGLILKAKDLLNLSTIVSNVNGCEFPEKFLIQIYSKLDHVNKPVNAYKGDSIGRFMTIDEKANVGSKAIQQADRFLRGTGTFTKTKSIIYAAFGELFAQLGADKGLEVIRYFEILRNESPQGVKLYESIVGLIIETLKPENRDFPFGWIAQLSDYAWVINSEELVNS